MGLRKTPSRRTIVRCWYEATGVFDLFLLGVKQSRLPYTGRLLVTRASSERGTGATRNGTLGSTRTNHSLVYTSLSANRLSSVSRSKAKRAGSVPPRVAHHSDDDLNLTPQPSVVKRRLVKDCVVTYKPRTHPWRHPLPQRSRRSTEPAYSHPQRPSGGQTRCTRGMRCLQRTG